MNSQTLGQEIYANLVSRGYRTGLEGDQFFARQIFKAFEETAELASSIKLPDRLSHFVDHVDVTSRETFDDKSLWLQDFDINIDAAKTELADIVVVILVAAEALSILDGRPFNVLEAARQKSIYDIPRGVRIETKKRS